jgi:excisionase family DNA binding protein
MPSTAPPVTAARLFDADALAQRWAVPNSHVYRLAREGRLPCVELGRYRRFTVEAIEEFERSGGTGGKQ